MRAEHHLLHHRQLEQAFETLARAMLTEDPIVLRIEWAAFERVLLAHLEEEEREMLPAFRHEHPAEARMILGEHDQIRAALLELGVMLDLHALREQLVAEFLDRLREHAAREERTLYPWMADRDQQPRRSAS